MAKAKFHVNRRLGTGPILLTCSFPYVRDWLNEHPFKNTPDARVICNLMTGSAVGPDAMWTVLEGMEGIDKKDDGQIVNELQDTKDVIKLETEDTEDIILDDQIVKETEDTEDIIKPENSHTHPLEASPPSPPSPFENNVNDTKEKDQDPPDVPVKPSDPSDPSANLDNDENKGIDKKQDRQIAKEIHGTAINNPVNSPSCSTIAPSPSPFKSDAANNTKSSVFASSISLDSLVVCKDEGNRLYSCPHCTKFKTNLEAEYQHHIVINHPRKPGYPNTAAVG
jgi:hypothetical protein